MTKSLEQTREEMTNILKGAIQSHLAKAITHGHNDALKKHDGQSVKCHREAQRTLKCAMADIDQTIQSYGEEVRQAVIEEVRKIVGEDIGVKRMRTLHINQVIENQVKHKILTRLDQLRSAQPKGKP